MTTLEDFLTNQDGATVSFEPMALVARRTSERPAPPQEARCRSTDAMPRLTPFD